MWDRKRVGSNISLLIAGNTFRELFKDIDVKNKLHSIRESLKHISKPQSTQSIMLKRYVQLLAFCDNIDPFISLFSRIRTMLLQR